MSSMDSEASSASSSVSSDEESSASSTAGDGSDGSDGISESDEPDVQQGSSKGGQVRPECLEWFKKVIEKIKGQKQRPGLDRIIPALKPFQEKCSDRVIAADSDKFDHFVKEQLSYAIRDGHLFKVWSNDMPSYKDTENLRKLRKFTVKSDVEVRRAVKAAVREIGEKKGTVEQDIVNYISYSFTLNIDRTTLEAMVKNAMVYLTNKRELIPNADEPGRFISKHQIKDGEGEGTSRPRSAMSAASAREDDEPTVVKKSKKKKKFALLKEETPLSSLPDSKPSSSSSAAKSSGSKQKGSAKDDKSKPKQHEASPEIQVLAKPPTKNSADSSSSPPKKDDKKKKREMEKLPMARVPVLKSEVVKIPIVGTSPPKASTSKEGPPPPPVVKASKFAEAMAKPSASKMAAAAAAAAAQAAKPEKEAVSAQAPGKAEKSTGSRVVSPRPSTSGTAAATTSTSRAAAGKQAGSAREPTPPAKKRRGRPPLKKNLADDRRKSKSPTSASASDTDSDPSATASSLPPGFEIFSLPAPKELQDSLSKFYTPTSARRSRNPLPGASSAAATRKPATIAKKTNAPVPTEERTKSKSKERNEKTKSKSTAKPKSSSPPSRRKSETAAPEVVTVTDTDTGTDGEDGRRGRKHGSQQLKGLHDGLSGYFKATDGDRKRKPPPSNFTTLPNRSKKAEKLKGRVKGSSGGEQTVSDGEEEEEEEEEDEEEEEEEEEEEDAEEKSGSEEGSEDEEEVADGESKSGSASSSGRSGKHVFKMPDKIPKNLENLFRKARERALEKIPTVEEDYDGPLPPRIQLGDKKIITWYTSPFPEEYIRCLCLYICEFCLQYMKTVKVLKSHYVKCPWHRPPGTEIYHDTVDITPTDRQELIVYETDGNDWKEYCQNLCLLAKLYLDHKTLYYDVEPFLFYVLTRRDKFGDHLIGYFSKEKNSPQRYNVSCIMVLPPYQGGGYGRYLIDFSYLLSRTEGQHGTPEKPLSELGQLSYHAYWKSAILDFFLDQRQKSATKTSIKAICDTTGMWPQDVADTLQQLGFIVKNEETKAWEFALLQDKLSEHVDKKSTTKKRLPLFPDKLRWDPWKGEMMGVTATESERSGSRAEQLTGDERRNANPSGDTSESELDQAMDVQQAATPEPTSPPVVRPGSQRSRGGTPRGRPGPRKSSSHDRSRSRPASTLPAVKRRGRPPKVDRRRKGHGRDGEGPSGGRKKRKGKFRESRRSSSKPTSSQPKNYKGRGEEFRAGAEKRRKHRRLGQSGDQSDVSSMRRSPDRRSDSSSSDSSAMYNADSEADSDDGSVTSRSTSQFNRGQSVISKDKDVSKEKDISMEKDNVMDNESSASGSESHGSQESHGSHLSHLDQPPRAPHPPQPLDMMDQGPASPVDHHHHVQPVEQPPTRQPSLPPPPAPPPPVVQFSSRAVETSIQTEPMDEMEPPLSHQQQHGPPSVQLEQYGPGSVHHMSESGVQTDLMVPSVGSHMVSSTTELLMPTPQSFQHVQAAQMMPSPISYQSTQPSTPYGGGGQQGPLSPQMSHGSVGPPSVLSSHDIQMSQESDMIAQTAGSYLDSNAYEQQHHYSSQQQQQPPPIMTATSPPGYQQYQQASPAGSQTSMHNVTPSYTTDNSRPPRTPTAAISYIPPSPRSAIPPSGQFSDQHPASPLAQVQRSMRTPMPVNAYTDYSRSTASVLSSSYPDPALIRNSRSVAPPRYNESCEISSAQQLQQQQQQTMPSAASSSSSHSSHPSSSSGHSSKQRSREHRQREQLSVQSAAAAPAYPPMHHPQQQLYFHPSMHPGYDTMTAAIQFNSQQAAYLHQQQAAHVAAVSDPMNKLTQMTRDLPSQQPMQHSGAMGYGGGGPSVGGSARSQSQSRQQQQHQQQQQQMVQQHVGMSMPSAAALQNPYHYGMTPNMMGKQTFPGQNPVMNTTGYPPAYFGPGVPMSGQVPGYARAGQVGAPGPVPYPPYPAQFYQTNAPQHPHSGHHTSMRQ
ncbi:Histone acetyltransferase KAT6B [Hypsibius exemplaris]|uniref:histone acetyltransferase n=1 Tax=Hypsibius exemplaris TaxID=2072580 RepID=A0A1W0WKT1_HYPEX|nr:Histone acetyltransferase KAT6B [Hypsibius exemplaris]